MNFQPDFFPLLSLDQKLLAVSNNIIKLEIKKWLIVGGSWGSTLGLTYSIKNPSNVLGLVLRGVFLGSKDETFWAFNDSA